MHKTYLVLLIFGLAFITACSDDDTTIQSHNCSSPVTIGSQIWMCQNLNVNHYRNGDSIPEVKDSATWANITTGAWCYYDNDSTHGAVYGKLYNWYAVIDQRGLAPEGWRIPHDTDWIILYDFLGGIKKARGKLKETGTMHWLNPNSGASNIVEFTALPGGFRGYLGTFGNISREGTWWTATEYNAGTAIYWSMQFDDIRIFRSYYNKGHGFSVRCIKNN